MGKSAATKAEARFRQLCCLGLGSEAVMPALFHELRTLIPSFGATFFWADRKGEMANVYDENPEGPRVAQTYFQEFRGRQIAGSESFAGSMKNECGVAASDNDPRIDMNSVRRTDLYNAILRPLGYDGFIRLVVRDKDQPLGGLVLWHAPRETGFRPGDKRQLAGLESFLAHALSTPAAADFPLVESSRVGLIVASTDGRPVYSSEEGRRLLFLATHPRIEPSADVRRLPVLPPALVLMCRNLDRVFAGAAAEPPVHHHRNVWGGFTFRANWLDAADTGPGLVAIAIGFEEPTPVRLMRALGRLPLSRRQAEVCLLMATGSSYDAIAQELGISRHTAISHSRWIYNKLDVHNRAELINKLLAS
jgi:DNA-binding CsgD family transcriptional regulator